MKTINHISKKLEAYRKKHKEEASYLDEYTLMDVIIDSTEEGENQYLLSANRLIPDEKLNDYIQSFVEIINKRSDIMKAKIILYREFYFPDKHFTFMLAPELIKYQTLIIK